MAFEQLALTHSNQPFEMERMNLTLDSKMHIHIVGIGGAGMSAIARVLLGRGFTVSGSDAQANALTAALTAEGATVFEGHSAENVAGADLLAISSAIPAENPEVVAANEQAIPVLKRADLLGLMMADNIGIAVAGSHGKTTTTGMISQLLMACDLDPTVIVGGVLPEIGNGRFGQGDYFVVEADEYDRMFLGLRPELAVITNIEHDHPDIYATEDAYVTAFADFAALLPADGRLIACGDDPGVAKLLAQLDLPASVETTTYGIGGEGQTYDVQAIDCRPNQLGGTDFLVEHDGQVVGLARLRVPGLHNVRNALAAIIVGLDLELEFRAIVQALARFGGVERRFQVTGEAGDVIVIDDYAHHPTEIRATLAAARQRYPGRRLWAVWQPHTFSRTRLLLEQFAASFDEADRVVVLDIYRSRETDTLGMDSAVIVNAMSHPKAVHIAARREAADYLLDRVRPDDVVITLGAGNGDVVGKWVLEGLQTRVGK